MLLPLALLPLLAQISAAPSALPPGRPLSTAELRERLATAERTSGPESPEAADAAFFLGARLHSQVVKLPYVLEPEAEQLLRRVYAIRSKAADASDPQVLNTVEALALILRHQGKIPEAESLEQGAKAARTARVQWIAERPASASYRINRNAPDESQRVTGPSLLSKVEPEYTDAARRMGHSGSVRLRTIVGKEGHIVAVQLLNSLGLGLDENAAEAVKRWQFQPGTKGGQPVDVEATIEVDFRLL